MESPEEGMQCGHSYFPYLSYLFISISGPPFCGLSQWPVYWPEGFSSFFCVSQPVLPSALRMALNLSSKHPDLSIGMPLQWSLGQCLKPTSHYFLLTSAIIHLHETSLSTCAGTSWILTPFCLWFLCQAHASSSSLSCYIPSSGFIKMSVSCPPMSLHLPR